MADEADMQATSNEEATVENTADSATEEQINDSGSNVSSETKEPESAPAGEVKEDNKTAPSNQEAKDDSKPISRRSAKYRIQQLTNEIKTLKEQKNPQPQDEWEAPQEEPQPDIQALIAQEVERRLNPVISESSKVADDGEINELFTGERAADKSSYEPKIREMWQLPQYKDVAASDLYKIAKFDDLANSMDSIKQQAIEEYKKAERQAKESSASGTSNISNRTGKPGKSISEMTDAELLEHNERVKAGLA